MPGGTPSTEPLLVDPVIYSRFLFVVPLLELAQVVVETSLGVQMRQFLKSGLVPEGEQPEFLTARAAVDSPARLGRCGGGHRGSRPGDSHSLRR